MTERIATLEYIGSMADQLAALARDAGHADLAARLSSAADLADRQWLSMATAEAAGRAPGVGQT